MLYTEDIIFWGEVLTPLQGIQSTYSKRRQFLILSNAFFFSWLYLSYIVLVYEILRDWYFPICLNRKVYINIVYIHDTCPNQIEKFIYIKSDIENCLNPRVSLTSLLHAIYCRPSRLELYNTQTGKIPRPTNILFMTFKNMLVRIQSCWSFGKCRILFHCQCCKALSGPEVVVKERVLYCEFNPRLHHSKDFKNGTWCLLA